MQFPEFNYGQNACTFVNGAYLASFNILVEEGVAPDAIRTRHYYGMLIPEVVPGGYPAVQHDAVTVMLETPELVEMVLSIARQQAIDVLNPPIE